MADTQKLTIQKNAVVVLREQAALQLLSAQTVEIQTGAILLVRDDIPPDEIDQIVKAARGVSNG